ncbi:MAG: preprotein translocase subunit SecY [Oscillospiraceae bacterium]|nr:preprotein translocase subunit SecY [Oscillospiraceae bacterium]MDO5137494.1 preprotein translocase subunit SecY [Oscillospiraceae bacterium]
MFQTFKNAWKIEDLRKRIIFTLMILVLFRLGCAITVPFVNAKLLAEQLNANSGTIFGFFDLMSGGSFSQAALFALGVSPYINSSIIVQLLQVVFPSLERLSREGEEGRRKLTRITRYVAVGLACLLAFMYYLLVKRSGALVYTEGFAGVFSAIVIVVTFAAGAMLLLWLGEQIDAKGIGSGISLIIFTGILANSVSIIPALIQYFQLATGTYSYNGITYGAEPKYFVLVPLVILLFFAMFVLIVITNAAERRIPVQYAKRVVGRKMYGGQSSYIPIKVNMSGVMPVIFASSLLSIPSTIKDMFGIKGRWGDFLGWFNTDNWGYAILYALLIIAFNYFYVAIQYNPVQIANDLRKNSGAIPGIRPGQPTSQFITRIINKITIIGALFLVVIATLPIILSKATGIRIALGGTSILIVVGVALEISQTLESYMLMRHHKGFLE